MDVLKKAHRVLLDKLACQEHPMHLFYSANALLHTPNPPYTSPFSYPLPASQTNGSPGRNSHQEKRIHLWSLPEKCWTWGLRNRQGRMGFRRGGRFRTNFDYQHSVFSRRLRSILSWRYGCAWRFGNLFEEEGLSLHLALNRIQKCVSTFEKSFQGMWTLYVSDMPWTFLERYIRRMFWIRLKLIQATSPDDELLQNTKEQTYALVMKRYSGKPPWETVEL